MSTVGYIGLVVNAMMLGFYGGMWVAGQTSVINKVFVPIHVVCIVALLWVAHV